MIFDFNLYVADSMRDRFGRKRQWPVGAQYVLQQLNFALRALERAEATRFFEAARRACDAHDAHRAAHPDRFGYIRFVDWELADADGWERAALYDVRYIGAWEALKAAHTICDRDDSGTAFATYLDIALAACADLAEDEKTASPV